MPIGGCAITLSSIKKESKKANQNDTQNIDLIPHRFVIQRGGDVMWQVL